MVVWHATRQSAIIGFAKTMWPKLVNHYNGLVAEDGSAIDFFAVYRYSRASKLLSQIDLALFNSSLSIPQQPHSEH